MEDNYLLVRWPESQLYMEEPWFKEEAILALGSEEVTGSSAYFIPENRILCNEYISARIIELVRDYSTSEDETLSQNKDIIDLILKIKLELDKNKNI